MRRRRAHSHSPKQFDRERAAAGKIIAVCGVLLLALWMLDLFILRTRILTPYGQKPALTPIYGFWMPLLRPQALVFLAAALLAGLAACRMVDPARVRASVFAVAVFAVALILPLALFWARQQPSEIGSQFRIYPGEEFLYDAERITDLSRFLHEYVELMPNLSLHGRHFPPGHAVLLYVIRKLFGEGTRPAGILVLVAFALGVVVAYLAVREHAGEQRGRQAAFLLLASPSLLDFACTSMDALFFLEACLAWWAGLRALSDTARIRSAVVAGLALLLAVHGSFSGILVGFVVLLYGLAGYRRTGVRAVVQILVIGASFAAGSLVIYLAAGFSLWSCFQAARLQNVAFITRVMGGSPESLYARIVFGNATAFAIGAGLALVSALVIRFRTGETPMDRWTGAMLAALAVMVFSGFYTLETERIWLYAMPWLALAVSRAAAFECRTLRALLAAGWGQALVMEILIFTLW